MTLLAPWGLLGLLAVPALVALSLWRRRRRESVASSLLLWRQVADARRQLPASRRQRRLDPLLVLRIAIALALTGALSGLAWVRADARRRHVALVLDRSASMAARQGAATRRAQAQGQLLRLVGTSPHDVVHLLPVPLPDGSGADEDRTLADRLSSLPDTHAAVAPADLLAAARDATARWPEAPVIVATDQKLQGLPPGARLLAVGGPADNRGIVAFAARQRRDGQHEVLVRVANAGQQQATVQVELRADDAPIAQRPLTIAAGEQNQAIFEARLGDATVLHARLDGSDALSADDEAWLARRGGRTQVALVGEPCLPLRRALEAVDDVDVVEQHGAPSGQAGLAVYYRTVPATLAGGTVVVVAPQSAVGQLRVAEETVPAKLTDSSPRDPLMTAVDLAHTDLGAVRRVALPQGFETLAASGPTPLIGRWREGDTTLIYVGIDPATCNWPLHPSFPIFWANVVREAAAVRRTEFAAARPGQLCTLLANSRRTTVRGPDGLPQEGRGVFRPERVGLYRATSDDGRKASLAVSLLSERETMEAGSGAMAPLDSLPASAATATSEARRLDSWLVLAALALILAHGWLAGAPGGKQRLNEIAEHV
ncbi:BatA domain-containing protein [bacterium]|nr:BatA domain-containing protein [bacterium]